MAKMIKPAELFLGALSFRAETKELRRLRLKSSKTGNKNRPRAGDSKSN